MRAPWDSAGNRSWFEQCRHGGGSESSASMSQTTTNQDQRAAADTGSVAASGYSTLSHVAVVNSSSDPAVIMAALRSGENQLALSLGAGVAQSQIAGSVAAGAIGTAGSVAAGAVGTAGDIVGNALDVVRSALQSVVNVFTGASSTVSQVAGEAIGAAQGVVGTVQSVAGSAISAGVTQSQITASTVNDLATTAFHENRALSQDAIDQWAAVVDQALNTSATSIHDALNSLAAQNTSTSALAAQSLGQVAPLQTSLKVIVYALAAVAIVFFLTRSSSR